MNKINNEISLLENHIIDNICNKTFMESYQEKSPIDFLEIERTPIDKHWIISFEGIDATGKQTLSNILKEYLNNLNKKEVAEKINIPDYNLKSGQEIKEILFNGNYEPELLQLKFALNRKEVQNKLILENKLNKKLDNQKNIFIFDRWVDSGAIFKIAKMIYNDIENDFQLYTEYSSYEECIHSKILEYKKELIKQYELEHNILELTKPNLKILCITPIEEVQKRLRNRLLDQGIPEDKIEDNLDAHEKNEQFLFIVQKIYIYIYSNPKIFFTNDIFSKSTRNTLIIDTYINSKEECIKLILNKLFYL